MVDVIVFAVFVVDLGFVEVSVGYVVPHLFEFNVTVEWMSKSVSIDVLTSRTNLGVVEVVVLVTVLLFALVCLVWGDDDVELEGHTVLGTLGQHVSEIEVEKQ